MVQADFGPGADFPKRLSNMEKAIAALGTRDVLQNASIGNGGITVDGGEIHVTNGGSIVVDGSGTITLPTGAFSSGSVTTNGLTVNGNESVTGTSTVGALSSSGAVSAASVSATGNVSASGQVISTGIINSPGTKSNTVTVGYSAVYIDSGGNMGGNTSSARFKTNIRPADLNLDGILALQPRTFQRPQAIEALGEDAPWQVGLIAEEVEPVAPWAVWHDREGLVEGIRYEELTVALLALVQRLEARVTELEKR